MNNMNNMTDLDYVFYIIYKSLIFKVIKVATLGWDRKSPVA